MPVYLYKAYNSDGKDASGSLFAETERDALGKVRQMGLLPASVKVEGAKSGFGFFKDERDDIPTVTRNLSTMLSAGVPLVEAIDSLGQESVGRWKATLSAMKERISGGSSFSRALEESGLFPDFYVNMAGAGEQSGTLDTMLLRLADYLERRRSVQAKVRTAMIYPAFMITVSITVVAFLFVFVIPKIVNIFNNYKAVLPLNTRILIFASDVFVNYWWLIGGVSIALGYAFRAWKKKNARAFDGFLLRLPGGLIQPLYYGRFARMLGLLLGAGVPMLRALELAGKSVGNKAMEESLQVSARRVLEGGSLSGSVDCLPPTFIRLIATGEKTGRMSEVLDRAAGAYEEDFSRNVDKALSVLEPVMILLMGGVVIFVVLSVLLPIFQLNSLVK